MKFYVGQKVRTIIGSPRTGVVADFDYWIKRPDGSTFPPNFRNAIPVTWMDGGTDYVNVGIIVGLKERINLNPPKPKDSNKYPCGICFNLKTNKSKKING